MPTDAKLKESEGGRYRVFRWILEGLLGLLVAALAFYQCFPLINFLVLSAQASVVQSAPGDPLLYVYYLRIGIEKLLGQGDGGFFDAGYFFPEHARSLLFTEHHLGATALGLPWWWISGDAYVTLALTAIQAVLLGWVGIYVLARRLGAGLLPALLAAMVFGTSGGFLSLQSQPFFWAAWLVPIVVVALDALMTRPSWWRATALGLVAALLGWSSSHLFVMATLLVIPFIAWRLTLGPRSKAVVGGLVLAAMITSSLLVPLYLAQWKMLYGAEFDRTLLNQAWIVPNLADFVAPSWLKSSAHVAGWLPGPPASFANPIGVSAIAVLAVFAGGTLAFVRIARSSAVNTGKRFKAPLIAAAATAAAAWLIPDSLIDKPVAHGTSACVYGATAFVLVHFRAELKTLSRSKAGWSAGVAILGLLMALGPVLPAGGGDVIPGPAILLCRLPGFSGIRASPRWALVFDLGLALSLCFLVQAVPRVLLRSLLSFALVVVLLNDAQHQYLPSWHFDLQPLSAPSPREIDVVLKSLPREGAVMELPFEGSGLETVRMMARLHHRHPIVNGYAGMLSNTFRTHGLPVIPSFSNPAGPSPADLAHLEAFGARYWILDLGLMPPSSHAAWKQALSVLTELQRTDQGRILLFEDPRCAGG